MKTLAEKIYDYTVKWDKQEIWREEIQPDIRAFVTDKSLPIDGRFSIWEKYSIKIDEPWIIKEEVYGVIATIARNYLENEYMNRYCCYSYKYFIEMEEESLAEFGTTKKEIQELIMLTNLGSFIMDW